jgi:hypothetical protein
VEKTLLPSRPIWIHAAAPTPEFCIGAKSAASVQPCGYAGLQIGESHGLAFLRRHRKKGKGFSHCVPQAFAAFFAGGINIFRNCFTLTKSQPAGNMIFSQLKFARVQYQAPSPIARPKAERVYSFHPVLKVCGAPRAAPFSD